MYVELKNQLKILRYLMMYLFFRYIYGFFSVLNHVHTEQTFISFLLYLYQEVFLVVRVVVGNVIEILQSDWLNAKSSPLTTLLFCSCMSDVVQRNHDRTLYA